MNIPLHRNSCLLRNTLRLPSTSRSFHASPRPLIVAELLTSTNDILHLVHNGTGLPWVATIPLTALAVRLTIILPVTIYSRRLLTRKIELQPLVDAWRHKTRASEMKSNPSLPPKAIDRRARFMVQKQLKEISIRWCCQPWKIWSVPIVQIPVFLTIMETLRRMSGIGSGFLGLLIPGSLHRPASDEAEKTLVSGTEGVDVLTPMDPIVPVEPGLATEGALWFPNLLIPDQLPLPLLPCILSAVMIANVTGTSLNRPELGQSHFRKGLRRGLIGVSLLMAPLTMQMPAAILVYWISTFTLGVVQHHLLDVCMPMPKRVKPCKHLT